MINCYASHKIIFDNDGKLNHIDRWFLINIRSNRKGYCNTFFLDITNEKNREEKIKKLTNYTIKYFDVNNDSNNYQWIAEDIREISNAAHTIYTLTIR